MNGYEPVNEQEENEEQSPVENMGNIAQLIQISRMANVAEILDTEYLSLIASECLQDYASDEDSMSEWLDGYERGIELASLAKETKTFPWNKAANVKFPIITNAAVKFNSRAYPELMRNGEVVGTKINGKDPSGEKQARGQRVSEYTNHQLLEKMKGWESDLDRLLMMLPCVGQMYKKTYYCPVEQQNISELVHGKDVVIDINSPNFERAPRKTHKYELSANEVKEHQLAGVFLEGVQLTEFREDGEPMQSGEVHTILEQHRLIDLDEDGYQEPYIVYIDKGSQQVLRIVAAFDIDDIKVDSFGRVTKINRDECFIPYQFMPDIEGGILARGYGHLLTPLNETVNTLMNQLLDAGTLANLQSGFFGKGLRVRGGNMKFQPGEWKMVDVDGSSIANNVFALPTKEPSPTLFSMLGLVIDAAKDVASIKDVLAGDTPGGMNVQPTTLLAMIEQGQKTFNAIYKRVWRSLKAELKKIYSLNFKYGDNEDYIRFHDLDVSIQQDFAPDLDVVPVADPSVTSQAQRIAQAQAVLSVSGRPGLDEQAVTKDFLRAIGHPNIEVIMPEQPPQQGPNPQMMALQKELELREREMQIKERELMIKEREQEAEVLEQIIKGKKTMAEALHKIALAEAAEKGSQLSEYKLELETIMKTMETLQNGNNSAANRGLVGQSSDNLLARGVPQDNGADAGNSGFAGLVPGNDQSGGL